MNNKSMQGLSEYPVGCKCPNELYWWWARDARESRYAACPAPWAHREEVDLCQAWSASTAPTCGLSCTINRIP